MQEDPASGDKDVNEAFEDIFMIEGRVFKEGFREGYEKATEDTNQEYYDLGYKNGVNFGEELGYYVAITEHYLNNEESPKINSALVELKGLLEAFPRENVKEDLVQLLGDVRAKFKRICALLKLKPLYPKENLNTQLSF